MKLLVWAAFLYGLTWGSLTSILWQLELHARELKHWEQWIGVLLLPVLYERSHYIAGIVLGAVTVFLLVRQRLPNDNRVMVGMSLIAGLCVWGMFAGKTAAFFPSLIAVAATFLAGQFAAFLLREPEQSTLSARVLKTLTAVGMTVLVIGSVVSHLASVKTEGPRDVSPDGAYVGFAQDVDTGAVGNYSEVIVQPRYSVLGLFQDYAGEGRFENVSWTWTGPHSVHVSSH